MVAGCECFQWKKTALQLGRTHSRWFPSAVEWTRVVVFFPFSRTPAELSLGIFNVVHNSWWSAENTPGTASASLRKTNRWCLLVGRRFVLWFCCSHRPAVELPTLRHLLCLLSVSPPAFRHLPLAQIVLLGWVSVSFQWVTPTVMNLMLVWIELFLLCFVALPVCNADSRNILGCLMNYIWTLQ